MRVLPALLLAASAVTATTLPASHHSVFQKRELDTCSDLTVNTNNGDRKVAIVVDSSLSMQTNDPRMYRIAAARALNNFLVANGEGNKPDQVAVVEFAATAALDYRIGDPSGADRPISNITNNNSGTFIASGVTMGLAQIQAGNGGTAQRSAIVVFTDGEDDEPDLLVQAIQTAADAGVRVSFGFISRSTSSQEPSILKAIRNSRGIYATIADPAGAQNFVNFALLNGLTYNDNPQGYDTQLLAGLGQTYVVSGSNTVTLKYRATAGERVNFTVAGISSTGRLTATASQGGSTLNGSTTALSRVFIDITAPGTGDIDLTVKPVNAPTDSLFSVLTNSNVPLKNCTVGVGGSTGLSAGAKAGIGVGVTVGVLGLLGTAGYFGYKHFFGPKATGPMMTSGTEGMHGGDPSQYAPTEKFGGQPNVTEMYPTNGTAPMAPPANGMGPPPNMMYPPGPETMYAPPPAGPPASGMAPFFPPIPPPMFPPNATKPMHPNGPDADKGPNMQYQDPGYQPDSYDKSHNPYQQPYQPADPPQQQPPQQQPPQQQPPQDAPQMPEHHRIPNLRRSDIERHHHHEWMQSLEQWCEDEQCPLNARDHRCYPDENSCPCECRIEGCPVTRQREQARNRKDAITTIASSAY